MTVTLDEAIKADAENGLSVLRFTMQDDPHILREDTQSNAIVWLYLLGRALVQKIITAVPEFETRLIADIARHAGNSVLGMCGSEQLRQLARWSRDKADPVDRHSAEDVAVSFFQDLVTNWWTHQALEAYLAATDEDDPWRERLETEIDNFETISSQYRTGLLTSADGLRALTWVATNSRYAENTRAMLPEGVEVPYYLDPQWYRDHGAD